MSKVMAVAARELRERWLFLPAGLAFGFGPLLLQPALGLHAEDNRFLGAVTAMGFMVAAAVVAGSSMLARDAMDGRLGFLFSRPIPWTSVWGGKWLGAILLALGTGLLVVLTSTSSVGLSLLEAAADPQRSLDAALVVVLCIGVANFWATVFRSRSRWVAVDLLLVPASVWLVRRWCLPLLVLDVAASPWVAGSSPVEASVWFPAWRALALLVPLAVALVLASAVQVAVGRTDIRRAHRAMSLAFWAFVLAALAVAGLRLAWTRAARPVDVDARIAWPDPTGRWAYLVGPSRRGGTVELLVDGETGRHVFLGLGGAGTLASPLRFSGDGQVAARLLLDREERTSRLEVFELSGPTPRASRVTLESSPPPTAGTMVAISPSGASVILVHESGASLYELPSGRRVATATLAPGWRLAATRFLAESTARTWLVPHGASSEASRPEVRVLDLAGDGSSRTASFELSRTGRPTGALLVAVDAAGRRLLTNDAGLHLRDGGTGALLATLRESPGPASALFLGDGRIVSTEEAGARTALRVFDRDGTLVGATTLDVAPVGLRVGPEVTPGRVGVAFARSLQLGETLVVDVAGLEVVERLPGLLPALPPEWLSSASSVGVGAARPHFFQDAQGRLVRIDFANGERRIVAGPGASAGERTAGP